MQVTQIAGRKFTTIVSMKQFALEHGMDLKGSSKWVKSQWIEKLESFMEVQAEVVAVAIEVKETIVLTEVEAVAPALTAAITIESAAVAAFQALTSPKACQFYRAVLQGVCLAIVFMALLIGKMARWCWENRDRAALYCWIEQWLDSPAGKAAVAYFWLGEWIVVSWVDSALSLRDGVLVTAQAVGDRALGRLGLGGAAIEIQ